MFCQHKTQFFIDFRKTAYKDYNLLLFYVFMFFVRSSLRHLFGGVNGTSLGAFIAVGTFFCVNTEFSQVAYDYCAEGAFHIAGTAADTLVLIDPVCHFTTPFFLPLRGSLLFFCALAFSA